MKVRHKDYFIYSHGSWRIFHASGSCWPDFFSELAIALIIPYILYNDNVMLRTVKIWLISEATNGEHVLASDQWYAYMNLPVTSILSYPFCTVVIISMYRTCKDLRPLLIWNTIAKIITLRMMWFIYCTDGWNCERKNIWYQLITLPLIDLLKLGGKCI